MLRSTISHVRHGFQCHMRASFCNSSKTQDDLFNYIGCPISKTRLTQVSPTEVKSDAGILFPIKNNIPILNPLKGKIVKDTQPETKT